MPTSSEKPPSRAIDDLPEAFISHAGIANEVSRRVARGRLRKLASRLYASNMEDDPATIVRRNLWGIVAGYFPGALIADRTAIEMQPAPDGSVCLVSERGTDVALPGGLLLRPRRGVPPQASDRPFLQHGLRLSSPARGYLDNCKRSRRRGGKLPRTLPPADLEAHLDRLLSVGGERAMLAIRDEARQIAASIGRAAEWKRLDVTMGALLGTRAARLSSPAAIARSRGRPYDTNRVALFERLAAELAKWPDRSAPAPARDAIGRTTFAFFEAYFSNYIEGTEFPVEGAADIVYNGRIPTDRALDAHDILGVWRVVSDPANMRQTPNSADQLLDLLRERHAIMLKERPEVSPGQFKTRPNQVGALEFVRPELVVGTLNEGFSILRNLDSPFARAVFVHSLVSETHPFQDGNGRLARIMMNAELECARRERIIVPTISRDDYIAAQRALSSGNSAEPIVKALVHLADWTAAVHWGAFEASDRVLRKCNAFETEAVRDTEGLRLKFPNGSPERRHSSPRSPR